MPREALSHAPVNSSGVEGEGFERCRPAAEAYNVRGGEWPSPDTLLFDRD